MARSSSAASRAIGSSSSRDAITLAGVGEGVFQIGEIEVEVRNGRVALSPTDAWRGASSRSIPPSGTSSRIGIPLSQPVRAATRIPSTCWAIDDRGTIGSRSRLPTSSSSTMTWCATRVMKAGRLAVVTRPAAEPGPVGASSGELWSALAAPWPPSWAPSARCSCPPMPRIGHRRRRPAAADLRPRRTAATVRHRPRGDPPGGSSASLPAPGRRPVWRTWVDPGQGLVPALVLLLALALPCRWPPS